MYYPNWIEDVCYESSHIADVAAALTDGFGQYYSRFVDTRAGSGVDDERFEELAAHFGTHATTSKYKPAAGEVLTEILDAAQNSFEKNRDRYQDLLDPAYLEEYESDPGTFKNTELRKRCPIIRATLQNTAAKQLDRYRMKFNTSDPSELLTVIARVAAFAQAYMRETYDPDSYEETVDPNGLGLSALGEEEYTVFGVIGGGIRSHLLFKGYPEAFPNRSQDALWALWYLTGKQKFGCRQDSEFLMINIEKSTTQQNYFYPYDLFVFYSLKLWKLLSDELRNANHEFNREYRYVMVDSFLSFVAAYHASEISDLKAEVRDDQHWW